MHTFTNVNSAPRNAIPRLPTPTIWPPTEPVPRSSSSPSPVTCEFNNLLRKRLRPLFAGGFPCYHQTSATAVSQDRLPMRFVPEVWQQASGLVQWRRDRESPAKGQTNQVKHHTFLFFSIGSGSGMHVDTLATVQKWDANGLIWTDDRAVAAWAYVACEPGNSRETVSKLFWVGGRRTSEATAVLEWYC